MGCVIMIVWTGLTWHALYMWNETEVLICIILSAYDSLISRVCDGSWSQVRLLDSQPLLIPAQRSRRGPALQRALLGGKLRPCHPGGANRRGVTPGTSASVNFTCFNINLSGSVCMWGGGWGGGGQRVKSNISCFSKLLLHPVRMIKSFCFPA